MKNNLIDITVLAPLLADLILKAGRRQNAFELDGNLYGKVAEAAKVIAYMEVLLEVSKLSEGKKKPTFTSAIDDLKKFLGGKYERNAKV